MNFTFISYSFNGTDVIPGGVCGDSLVIGPFYEAGTVRTRETTLAWLLFARLLVMGFILVGLCLLLPQLQRRMSPDAQ